MIFKKSLIVFLVLMCLAGVAYADNEWSKNDAWLGVAAATLTVVDWRQTHNIVSDPSYHERNWLLPNRPTASQVNRHFLLTSLVVGSLAHFLPDYRTEILSVYVTVQTINTVRNYSIGLRVRF